MKYLMFALLSLLGTSFIVGCEVTPYDVQPDSCLGLTIQSNIDKIKEMERAHPNKTSFKVALLGDPQTNPQSFADAIGRINDRTDVDFLFVLGDLSDTGLQTEFDWVCKSLQKSKIPFVTVVGNHDSISNGKTIWKKYFGPFNFAFSYLGTKFIAYNDNGYEFRDVPDQNFIQNEAKVQPGETRYHTIGASHVPADNADVHDQNFIDGFLSTLNQSKIELTIHGHRHFFFFQKDVFSNTHYVVAKTWYKEWGLMTIHRDHIVMENCVDTNCQVVTAQ